MVLYVPGAHAVQVEALAAPVAELYVPATHAVQVAELLAPVALLYVPAAQDVGAEDPAGQ